LLPNLRKKVPIDRPSNTGFQLLGKVSPFAPDHLAVPSG
jgi:hypothetical protein